MKAVVPLTFSMTPVMWYPANTIPPRSMTPSDDEDVKGQCAVTANGEPLTFPVKVQVCPIGING
jgi:hypothetical protein